MVAPGQRNLLGTFGWGERISVFLAPDSVEFEARGLADIERRRLYLDDIAMVTRSKRLNWFFLVPAVVLCGLTMLPSLAILVAMILRPPSGESAALYLFPAALLLVSFVLFVQVAMHLFRKDDIISIFGRRRKIEIRFGFFKKKLCDESYAELIDAVQRANARAHEKWERERPADFLGLMPDANDEMGPASGGPVAPQPVAEPVKMLTKFENGEFVEYDPRMAPAPKPPRPVTRDSDLPFLPEIKIAPKPPEGGTTNIAE